MGRTALAATGVSPFLPNSPSPNGQRIAQIYDLISIPAILIFLLVESLLLIVILKYRRSKQPAGYAPPQWHGNTKLEIIWTAIPLMIVLAIASLSFIELARDFTPQASANADMEITITAFQFGWDYQYPEGFHVTTSGFNSPPMVVPVGKLVRIRVRTRDVIHSWWVPGLMGKTDAVPGYDNLTWIRVGQPGVWRGQCAELCGVGHATMVTYVKAVPQAEYDKWVAEQVQKSKASPSPSASPTPSPAPTRSP